MIYQELDIEPIDMFRDLWWDFYLEQPLGTETRAPIADVFIRLGMRVVGEQVEPPHYELLFHDEEGDIFFEVSNGDDISPHVTLGIRADHVLPPDSAISRLNADRFLDYGKVCYEALRPLYAFADNMNAYVEPDDIVAPRLTCVFWAQFFGPAFVRGVGQTMLLNAPAWRNENLGDGGLLYVLAASPYLYRGPRQYWEQARDYFSHYNLTPLSWSDRQS